MNYNYLNINTGNFSFESCICCFSPGSICKVNTVSYHFSIPCPMCFLSVLLRCWPGAVYIFAFDIFILK